ncbi:MAG: PDDEXK nuclease domain-containing protein [Crocinitomicaceae bacterium]|nr:PDDEXK nuclease domain-containing protein [Crocinitomicaceae bacterium]
MSQLDKSNNLDLVKEISLYIKESKQQLAITVNATLSLLYWQIGKRINEEILQNQRAEYGKEIVASLALALSLEFGKGWSEKHLRHCLRTAETFQNKEIFYALSRELTWTHIRSVIYIEDDLKRDFYIEMCKLEKWSTRTLQERIQSMLFERTAISKKPEQTIKNELELLNKEQKLSADLVFRDPYVLDFLGLKDAYSEKDLESTIIAELQRFISELGSDFAFLARQKRITIDTTDYYIDLLFYHRRLKCLVAIDLKIGNFEASYKGQMELYLRYLEKYEQVEGENSPLGLILCSGKNEEHVELLQLDKSNIRVADYLTVLPSQEVLKQKLHQAIEIARKRYDSE